MVGRMEMLKGPFGSWVGFLSCVALPNCADYFLRVNAAEDEPSNAPESQNRELARFLFSAVVSLDAVVDYKCHETDPPTDPEQFVAAEPALKGLRDVANALKHRVRGKGLGHKFKRATDKKHAADQASARVVLKVSLGEPAPWVDVEYQFSLDQTAHDALTKAWLYWMARVP